MAPALAALRAKVANRTARVRDRPWRMRPYRSEQRLVIVGGAPRSGTTLLRRVLDRHPDLCAGPETKLFIPAAANVAWLAQAFDLPSEEIERMRRESRSQAAFIDTFAERVLAAAGKERWVEKTPMNIQHLDWISEHFPRASIVHLIRDGRDVVCSMREHPDWRWADGTWQKGVVPRPVDHYARRWVSDTGLGMRWRDHARYVEVRYEDLVADPAGQLRRLCGAIDAEVDGGWLAAVTATEPPGDGPPDDRGPISGASIGRWRADLTPTDEAIVGRVCGERLRELGYPT